MGRTPARILTDDLEEGLGQNVDRKILMGLLKEDKALFANSYYNQTTISWELFESSIVLNLNLERQL